MAVADAASLGFPAGRSASAVSLGFPAGRSGLLPQGAIAYKRTYRSIDRAESESCPQAAQRQRLIVIQRLGETGPLSQGVQARRKTLRIRHINGMEVRKKRPRGFKKRPRGFK